MDERLAQAYRGTDYCLWLNHRLVTLRIDQPAADIVAALTAQAGLQDQAYIVTPCNPRSKLLTTKANRERVRRFRARLDADGVRWLPALNRDPSGYWPEEAGALLMDCGETYALDLACGYAQNAVVRITRTQAPELVPL